MADHSTYLGPDDGDSMTPHLRAAFQSIESTEAYQELYGDQVEVVGGITCRPAKPTAPSPTKSPMPELAPLSSVEAVPVDWLWPSRIAIGKLTLLVGDPGKGKSHVSLDIAARVTRGQPWPDGAPPGPAGGVLLVSCEDDLADTVRPRLDAAGADVARVVALTMVKVGEARRMFSFDEDLPVLEQAISMVPGCRLVVVDPLSAYLGGTDSHKNSDVRALLAPLGELASRHGVALLAVSHLNKGNAQAMYRTTGSLAFVAAARAGWLIASDQADPARRYLLSLKNNLAADVAGMAFRLMPSTWDPAHAVVSWEAGPVTITADRALTPQIQQRQRDTATEWLEEQLADGPVAQAELKELSEQEGFAWRTVMRAKHELGIKSVKHGHGGWSWELEGCQLPSQESGTLPNDE